MMKIKTLLRKKKQPVSQTGPERPFLYGHNAPIAPTAWDSEQAFRNGYHAPVSPIGWPIHNPDSFPRPQFEAIPAELEAVAGRTPVPIYVLSRDDLSSGPSERQQSIRSVSVREETDRRMAAEWQAQTTAEESREQRMHNASTQNIRRLRGLIREKYRLDVYVWNKRGVQKAMRPTIKQEAWKSDAILQEILFIVNAWREDQFAADGAWELANKIKDMLTESEDQHLLWRDVEPWDEKRLRRLSEDSDQWNS